VEPVDGLFIEPNLVAVDYKNLLLVCRLRLYLLVGMSHVKLTLSFIIGSTAI